YRPEINQLEDRRVPAVIGSINFQGLGSDGFQDRPDTSLAVGPAQLVETVNSSLAFFDRASGAEVARSTLGNFFAPVRGAVANGVVFDPVTMFDELAGTGGRFVIAALDVDDANQRAFVDIAVSDTNDVNAGFKELFRIETTEALPNGQLLWGGDVRIGKN